MRYLVTEISWVWPPLSLDFEDPVSWKSGKFSEE